MPMSLGYRKWLPAQLVFTFLAAGVVACQPPNHYLIHPTAAPHGIVTWSDDVQRGKLRIHLRWAAPAGSGPFPTVLVHPEAGKTAEAMQGVIWDLASHGYLAVAADYRRLIDGEYRRNTFAWRNDADATAALEVIGSHELVDRQRVATLGFSQGGVFSLMIAARAADRISAVVAYYPVTDFEHWLERKSSDPIEGLVYGIIRWRFRRESGAATEHEFRELLRRASPLLHAERIKAPVLLIHGDRDRAADVTESQRLAERLAKLDREVRLVVVPDAVHIFNFRQPDKAQLAWGLSLQWLARHLLAPNTAATRATSAKRPDAAPPASAAGR